MPLLNEYQARSQAGKVVNDPEQIRVLRHLGRVYQDLETEFKQRSQWYAFLRKPRQVKGAYIWGGVGIGKTFMMDTFYQHLPIEKKIRLHFHAFMRFIHQRLKELQGKTNPLDIVATEVSEKAIVLCLDELLVTDITDAMILARLFEALRKKGVCLVLTSNMKPDDLYLRGLQRDQFIPAIELLKAITDVIHVPTKHDYREQVVDATSQHQGQTEQSLKETFLKLAEGHVQEEICIDILDRQIQTKMHSDNAIWFDFEEICRVPRSQHDYLELASKYKTIFVSNIREITPDEKNTISLFVRMIDVFYDAGIRFVYSSEKMLDDIYTTGHMIFDYARTRSRLIEMQRSVTE